MNRFFPSSETYVVAFCTTCPSWMMLTFTAYMPFSTEVEVPCTTTPCAPWDASMSVRYVATFDCSCSASIEGVGVAPPEGCVGGRISEDAKNPMTRQRSATTVRRTGSGMPSGDCFSAWCS